MNVGDETDPDAHVSFHDVPHLCCIAALLLQTANVNIPKTEHLQEVVRIGYTAWTESRAQMVSRSPTEALQNQPWFRDFFRIESVFDLIGEHTVIPPRLTTTGFRVHSLMTFSNIIRTVFGGTDKKTIVAMWHPTEHISTYPAYSMIFARIQEKYFCFKMRCGLRAQMTVLDTLADFETFLAAHVEFRLRDTKMRGTVTVLDRCIE